MEIALGLREEPETTELVPDKEKEVKLLTKNLKREKGFEQEAQGLGFNQETHVSSQEARFYKLKGNIN